MQRRVIVSANDGFRAETTQSLSNLIGDSTEFVNSSRTLQWSRSNSRVKYELPILLSAANTRVPARNSSSAIGGNFE